MLNTVFFIDALPQFSAPRNQLIGGIILNALKVLGIDDGVKIPSVTDIEGEFTQIRMVNFSPSWAR